MQLILQSGSGQMIVLQDVKRLDLQKFRDIGLLVKATRQGIKELTERDQTFGGDAVCPDCGMEHSDDSLCDVSHGGYDDDEGVECDSENA